MIKLQEPKYDAVLTRGDNSRQTRLINRETGEAIPDDEPIFIFRARDKHARDVLLQYSLLVADENHRRVILQRCGHFDQFAQNHPDRMHEPDSAPLA